MQRADPVPVSAPPWDAPEHGTRPRPYGTQRIARFRVGELATREKQIVDCAQPSTYLYRVSIFSTKPALLRVVYGTQGTLEVDLIRTPFVASLPGQVAIYVRPLVDVVETELVARCTVTQASGGARSEMRSLIDATGGAVAFHTSAARFSALVAATATIAGVTPVAVAALASVPLVAGSTLLTGSGFQEFEP